MKLKVFLLMLVILIAGCSSTKQTSPEKTEIQLHVDSPNVLVNSEKIEGKLTYLKEGDIIETSENGIATVILYSSLIVTLDPSTIISFEDLTRQHPKLKQEKGETWNKFTGVLGVEEYSIETGNSIASVRGTAFDLSNNKIIIGEGNVNFEIEEEKFELNGLEVVEKINDQIVKRLPTSTELVIIKKRVANTNKYIEKLIKSEQQKQIPSKDAILKLQEELEINNKAIEQADNLRKEINTYEEAGINLDEYFVINGKLYRKKEFDQSAQQQYLDQQALEQQFRNEQDFQQQNFDQKNQQQNQSQQQ